MQTASHLIMVRPVNFSFNAETSVNNTFQVAGEQKNVQENAVKEFDDFVQLLIKNNIDVSVIRDSAYPVTPDSIFPNNWISFHEGRKMCLYPMFAPNRRLERKPKLIATLQKIYGIAETVDFTHHENDNRFLEGTGSMVLDRESGIAYACISPRTSKKVLDEFCTTMDFQPVFFNAVDAGGQAIYHTNVMMCVANPFVVICLESITDANERNNVISVIKKSGKEIIAISMEQMQRFAGNVLQVTDRNGNPFLLMSTQAFNALTPAQVRDLERYNPILHASLSTIEANGGGSARCMIAELFQ